MKNKNREKIIRAQNWQKDKKRKNTTKKNNAALQQEIDILPNKNITKK